MPRPPRLDYPGARHHVMNRGARREVIFGNEDVCAVFLSVLGDLPERFGLRVHGYALMPNHYHLLVESGPGPSSLSRAMQHLGAAFTQALNRRVAGWDGPVFRGRFKNQLVEDDDYWRHLLAYLHLNPLRANLAPSLEASRWTSHAAYVGHERRPDWLCTDELLSLHGGIEGYLSYVWEAQVGRQAPPAGFDANALWRPRRTESIPARIRPARTAPLTAEAALAQVCSITGATDEGLRLGRVGAPGQPERWIAAWWLQTAAGLDQGEIAALLGANIQQVSRWLSRVRRAEGGSKLDTWQAALRNGLGMRNPGASGKS